MIKTFSSDSPEDLDAAVNAWLGLQRYAKNVKIHFAMTRGVEEASAPGKLPKTGGPYIEYGVMIEFDEVAVP